MAKLFKNDFEAAKARIIVEQAMVTIKKSLLSKYPGNKQSLSKFLDSELGSSLLLTTTGFVFRYVPKFKSQAYADILGQQFKHGGMNLVNLTYKNLSKLKDKL